MNGSRVGEKTKPDLRFKKGDLVAFRPPSSDRPHFFFIIDEEPSWREEFWDWDIATPSGARFSQDLFWPATYDNVASELEYAKGRLEKAQTEVQGLEQLKKALEQRV